MQSCFWQHNLYRESCVQIWTSGKAVIFFKRTSKGGAWNIIYTGIKSTVNYLQDTWVFLSPDFLKRNYPNSHQDIRNCFCFYSVVNISDWIQKHFVNQAWVERGQNCVPIENFVKWNLSHKMTILIILTILRNRLNSNMNPDPTLCYLIYLSLVCPTGKRVDKTYFKYLSVQYKTTVLRQNK